MACELLGKKVEHKTGKEYACKYTCVPVCMCSFACVLSV